MNYIWQLLCRCPEPSTAALFGLFAAFYACTMPKAMCHPFRLDRKQEERMTVKVQEEKEEDEEVGDRGGGQKLEDCSKNQCGVVQGRHNRRWNWCREGGEESAEGVVDARSQWQYRKADLWAVRCSVHKRSQKPRNLQKQVTFLKGKERRKNRKLSLRYLYSYLYLRNNLGFRGRGREAWLRPTARPSHLCEGQEPEKTL